MGSPLDGEVELGPGSPKEDDSSIPERNWCFHVSVVIDEEDTLTYTTVSMCLSYAIKAGETAEDDDLNAGESSRR